MTEHEHYDVDDDMTLLGVARVAAALALPGIIGEVLEDGSFQLPVRVDYENPLTPTRGWEGPGSGPHRARIELALEGVCRNLQIGTPAGDLALDTLVHVWPDWCAEHPIAEVQLTRLQPYTALVLVCGVARLDVWKYLPPRKDGRLTTTTTVWCRLGEVSAAIRDANEAHKKAQQAE